jgi:6-phosphogluconolactonase (cycloisomerase 2 family)
VVRGLVLAGLVSFGCMWLASAASASPAFLQVQGSPFATGEQPYGIAFNASGTLLATANREAGTVSVFTVGSSGALTLVASTATGAEFPESVAFSPDGKWLAVADTASLSPGSISMFAVAPNGTLSKVSGSPFQNANAGDTPSAVAFSPNSQMLASAEGPDGISGGVNQISLYKVGATGALSEESGSPYPASVTPSSVAFSPDGFLLAVGNYGSGSVSMYNVFFDNTLGLISTVPAGTTASSVAFSPDGSLLATGDVLNTTGAGKVVVFNVGQTGTLTPVTGSPFTAGNLPYNVTFDPAGGLLAVSNDGSNSVSVFSVGPTGALTPVAGSPFGTDTGPYGVAFNPKGDLLATANSTSTGIPDQFTGTVTILASQPSATIAAPASGGVFGLGQSVATSFSCAPAIGSPPIASCVDSTGHSAPGGLLNTSALGVHTYTVTATSQDGHANGTSISYTVVPQPTAAITSPANGQTFLQGQSAPTSFSCADGAGGPGIAACTDSTGHIAPTGALDTSTVGVHTYAVTSVSRDGVSGSASITYGVVAASISKLSLLGSTASMTVTCHGVPGQECAGPLSMSARVTERGSTLVAVAATTHKKKPKPKPKPKPKLKTVTMTVAQGSVAIAAGGSAKVVLRLNSEGRHVLGQFYKLPTALSFRGLSISPGTVKFSYPLVTASPDSSWGSWSWVGQPCGGVCWTSIDSALFWGVPKLAPTAKVKVQCFGGGCPRPHSFGPGKRKLRLDSVFAGRHLNPGTRIQLQITAPNSVGRLITWTTVVGNPPKKKVQCLVPGDSRPVTCAKGSG